MLKRLVLFLSILFLLSPIVQANVKKIAVVDVQKVVNKSAQVQALKKEQEAKRKELSNFIKKAGEDINKETDSAKKKALMDKYDKQLKTKQETNLIRLAKKIAREVKISKVDVKLDNMNSYERRIIHNALTNNKYVTTTSEGEEPNRHVVIKYKEQEETID